MRTSEIKAVVFDVLGTVVDEDGSVQREARELFDAVSLPVSELPSFIDEWGQLQHSRLEAIRSEGADWMDSDAIRGVTLREVITSRGWEVPDKELEGLATAGHRLDPWPDSVTALEQLARQRPVVALTNGSFSQMVDTFVHAGLRWSLVLSADLVQTFKPAPEMYHLPPTLLKVPAEQMLFVAAHPWDLDAAAAQGYRTALIRRPGTSAEDDDRFDLSVPTIADLADLLART